MYFFVIILISVDYFLNLAKIAKLKRQNIEFRICFPISST